MSDVTLTRGTIGLVTELKAQQVLLSLGVDVLAPVGANTPYDLVAHVAGRFCRIQVKTGRASTNNYTPLQFNSSSGIDKRPLTAGECDVILVLHHETGEFHVAYPNGKAYGSINSKQLDETTLRRVSQLFAPADAPAQREPGVHYLPRNKRWNAKFVVDGRRYELGSWETYEEACAALRVGRENHAHGEPVLHRKGYVVEGWSRDECDASRDRRFLVGENDKGSFPNEKSGAARED